VRSADHTIPPDRRDTEKNSARSSSSDSPSALCITHAHWDHVGGHSYFRSLAAQPDAFQPYLILREHVIDRIYDQNVGYWEANLQGLAHPSRADRAELLVHYLGLSEAQIVKAADRLAADGKYEMAAELLETAEPRFPGSASLQRAKRFAYLKLMEKDQNTDPFRFIIYSAKAGEPIPQINAEGVKGTRGAM
jgi:hypothetical protein